MLRRRILSCFARTTGGQKLIPEIDGLRFFAIAVVMMYHANIQAYRALHPQITTTELVEGLGLSTFTQTLSKGIVGVNVFFAISGFILGLPFARHYLMGKDGVPLSSYFSRRISRLEVPYLTAMLLAFLLYHLRTGTWAWLSLMASSLYSHKLIFGVQSPINPVSWSLEIEVQFYCLAPLLALIFSFRSRITRLTMIVMLMIPSILMRSVFEDMLPTNLSQSLIGYLFYFLVGFIALEGYMSGALNASRRKSLMLDLVGVVSIAVLMWPSELTKLERACWFVPACLGLFAAGFRGRAFQWFFSNPWTITLGGMCYSIYLIHYGAMIALASIFGKHLLISSTPWLVSTTFILVMIPLSLIPSAVFFIVVEKPCMSKGWFAGLLERIRGTLFDRA